ncbi:MAG: GntR family transcriptional regulator [Anaerovoracaceae bacterium]
MSWKFNDSQPIYKQISEELEKEVISGVYKPGDQLPSVRDLAMQAGVNPNTMQKGLMNAEQDRIIYSDRTRGRFVTDDQTIIDSLRREISGKMVRDFFSNMRSLGIGDGDIVKAVTEWNDGGDEK